MKPTQWAVAAILLAAMVFGLTFAMNYLQRPQPALGPSPSTGGGGDHELTFLTSKSVPIEGSIDAEVRASSHHDFWFVNDQDSPLVAGVSKLGCVRCTSIEGFVVPLEQGTRDVVARASMVGLAAGPLPLKLQQFERGSFLLGRTVAPTNLADVPVVELYHDPDKTLRVPAHGLGCFRMHWKGEKAGPQTYTATVWMHRRDSGRIATLNVSAFHYEPLRTNQNTYLGALNDDLLVKGHTRQLFVWSSTRPTFQLEAKLLTRRGGDRESDPFALGAPERLTVEEMAILEARNNASEAESSPFSGRVLCGYKIPLTVRAVALDKKTPIEVGPFRRTMQVTSPEVGGDAVNIVLQGRVRGLIELGNEDDETGLNFLRFPRRVGRKTSIKLYSNVPGLKLEFDRTRTPEYLNATLNAPSPASDSEKTRQVWTLTAEVPKNKVSGPFPRPEDPLYEDSAVYLRALEPGKPPRPVRIPARGTADES